MSKYVAYGMKGCRIRNCAQGQGSSGNAAVFFPVEYEPHVQLVGLNGVRELLVEGSARWFLPRAAMNSMQVQMADRGGKHV